MDKKLLMMALLITTGLATHAQEKLTRYQVRNAITVTIRKKQMNI